jgi:hypothetical protein
MKDTPLLRAGRRSLLRNLAAAARNLGDTSMAGPLREILPEEDSAEVREEIGKTLEALGESGEEKEGS